MRPIPSVSTRIGRWMRRTALAAVVAASSALAADGASAALTSSYSSHDLTGLWRFDAMEIDLEDRSAIDVNHMECDLELRRLNVRRVVTDTAICYDRASGWYESDHFNPTGVDFIVKSDGTVEVYFEDQGYLRGQFTRDRRMIKGMDTTPLLGTTDVVWTMTKK